MCIFFFFYQVGELVTGWAHSAMWNNSSHLAMITFFMANSLFEIGYFYKVVAITRIKLLALTTLQVVLSSLHCKLYKKPGFNSSKP